MELENRINKYPVKNFLSFSFFHLVPLAAIWTGTTKLDWIVCVTLYFARMFFVTGFYHRYFSHKTFKTSRIAQFIFAFLAQTSFQKGVLWWGAHHRIHHRTSDTAADPHSMKLYGFWYSHMGWIISPEYKKTEINQIQDFNKFPELRFLNKYHWIPGIVLAIGVFIFGAFMNSPEYMFSWSNGWSTLLIGMILSTAILFHGTFSINSIMHKFGRKRYDTGDESKNSPILAFITLGEGWHNNHHYYMMSTRQGFFWWEFDITYYLIKLMSFVRIVWDIQEVPDEVKYSKNMKEALAKMKAKKEQEEVAA